MWFARTRYAGAQVRLLPVGEGRFRMNLADPRVADELRAEGDAGAIFVRGNVDLDVPEALGAKDPFARIGPRMLPLRAGPGAPARLELTAAIAAAWREHGELEVGCDTQQGAVSFRLRAFPERAQGKEAKPLRFKVDEHATAPVPGTGGAVHMSAGEVSGDHVRLRLHTAEGVAVIDDEYRQDGRVASWARSGASCWSSTRSPTPSSARTR